MFQLGSIFIGLDCGKGFKRIAFRSGLNSTQRKTKEIYWVKDRLDPLRCWFCWDGWKVDGDACMPPDYNGKRAFKQDVDHRFLGMVTTGARSVQVDNSIAKESSSGKNIPCNFPKMVFESLIKLHGPQFLPFKGSKGARIWKFGGLLSKISRLNGEFAI